MTPLGLPALNQEKKPRAIHFLYSKNFMNQKLLKIQKSNPFLSAKQVNEQMSTPFESFQEETENHQQINQKSIKNQSWRGPGGSLEALGGQHRKMRGAPGFLGPSWGRLGGLLGPSWRPLGAVLAVLAASWAVLGRLKIDVKIDQKFDVSWDRFLLGFEWILGGKMEPSWYQNGIKNRC